MACASTSFAANKFWKSRVFHGNAQYERGFCFYNKNVNNNNKNNNHCDDTFYQFASSVMNRRDEKAKWRAGREKTTLKRACESIGTKNGNELITISLIRKTKVRNMAVDPVNWFAHWWDRVEYTQPLCTVYTVLYAYLCVCERASRYKISKYTQPDYESITTHFDTCILHNKFRLLGLGLVGWCRYWLFKWWASVCARWCLYA